MIGYKVARRFVLLTRSIGSNWASLWRHKRDERTARYCGVVAWPIHTQLLICPPLAFIFFIVSFFLCMCVRIIFFDPSLEKLTASCSYINRNSPMKRRPLVASVPDRALVRSIIPCVLKKKIAKDGAQFDTSCSQSASWNERKFSLHPSIIGIESAICLWRNFHRSFFLNFIL
jgi:hypothetical protein